jgi:ankyrin repeat protein
VTRIGRWWKPAAILLIVATAVQAAGITIPIARVSLALWRRGLPLTDHAAAVHAASRTDDVEMLALLSAAGADFDAPNADGDTALHTAAAAGAAGAAAFLVANGIHVDTQGRAGPALAVALEEDHLTVARVLLAHGADARVVIGRERRPAPVQVALIGDVRKMKLLLSLGIPPDVAGADGLTALAYAVSRNDEPMARALLEAGATTQSGTTGPDRSLLEQAIRNGRMDMVELLLAHGADATALSREGQPLLPLAVALGRVDIAAALLDAGVAVDTELAPLPSEQFLALRCRKVRALLSHSGRGHDAAHGRRAARRSRDDPIAGRTRGIDGSDAGALQVSARFGCRPRRHPDDAGAGRPRSGGGGAHATDRHLGLGAAGHAL